MSKPQAEKDIEVPQELILDLLTDSEWRMVKQRFEIVKLLEEGLSIRAIAKSAKVGTDTVVRISRMLEASPKLRQAFLKYKSSSNSKWVFGQADAEE